MQGDVMLPVLKLVSNNVPGRGAGESNRTPKAGNGADHKSTILVVEDEILIRLTTADYLREHGYRVLEASNAGEALSVFASGEPIELVFSDVNMPGKMNGADLARWIRQHFPDVKVLLTSGDPTAANDPTTAAGAPVVKKPYVSEALLAEIKRLLKS